MKLYKVLNQDLKSPYQNFQFKIGEKYHCEDFDESDKECSRGFYATDIDGLPYAYNIHRKVYECEVSGKFKEFGIYKRRYENFELIREVSKEELIRLAKDKEDEVGYKLSEVLNPINPLLIERTGEVTEEEIKLLEKWASVRASVRDSVGASVWDSVWDSVEDLLWASVWDSVEASVWASVRASVEYLVEASVEASVEAYISTLFPNLFPKGVNPFQPCIDLWKAGLVPSFDGKTWRLHSGKDAKVVYEERTNK